MIARELRAARSTPTEDDVPRRAGDFSESTKRRLADDAGNRCSLPDCRLPTQGGSVKIGNAAHIYSAASAGPRGQGGLSTIDLAAEANGIWCCASHAKQIDSARGGMYTPGTLCGYKDLAHARALVELKGGMVPKCGWFHELTVRSPIFPSGLDLRLGKATMVMGRNGSGKTILARCLAGFADPSVWESMIGAHEDHSVSIRYFDPEPRTYGVALGRGRLERTRDGRGDLPVGAPVFIRYCSESNLFDYVPDDDLSSLALAVGESRRVITAVLTSLTSPEIAQIRVAGSTVEIKLEDGNEPSRHRWMRPSMLSAGERSRLQFAIQMAVTRRRAQDLPTLLVVDDLPGWLDDAGYRSVMEQLADPALPFQTLVLTRGSSGAASPESWACVEIPVL